MVIPEPPVEPVVLRESPKQLEIMNVVFASVNAGEDLTLTMLRERLSYAKSVSRQAVQCSLNYLARAGYIVKEYRGQELVIRPTQFAFHRLRPKLV